VLDLTLMKRGGRVRLEPEDVRLEFVSDSDARIVPERPYRASSRDGGVN
jgi:hypothetical protein